MFAAGEVFWMLLLVLVIVVVMVLLSTLILLAKQYKRCPSNRVLGW
jgi:hypothetical protein